MKASWFMAALVFGACQLGTAANAEGVLKIGVLNDQSGIYADFGGKTSVTAAKMAVEDFGGEVLGRKIEVIDADHTNKPDVAASVARKWFDTEGVEMITDLTNSAVALAVQNLAKDKGKITIATGPFSSALTNESCSPTGFHWTFDTYAAPRGVATGMIDDGAKNWFILATDYAFGHAMQQDLTDTINKKGAKVVGAARAPLGTSDFASFLLQAQSSKANVIALANAGTDMTNAIKQAGEFGIMAGGQRLAALAMVISDVHSLGLKTAHGLVAATPFYWDRDDASRAFGKRFMEKTGRMPGMVQAGTYSGVLHYLKAVKAAGSTDGAKVADKMREMPVKDFFADGATVRKDGRVEQEMYLVQVKKPEESKQPWDYYKIVSTLPASLVTRPLSESKCPLVK
ncbi:ABC transporter substrate-binding protein [Comamonas sp. NLF-1-9]|uniref:ABC transporter substrate-binding protein n=1 Tax=Comamonas sp. NLF-1-9 TaxID=2853163 RepID=UPI001C4723F1|nr:ABC transporter substrate-binding protein [Comamonas sp. NLF-1-9]QXL83692.1 ABC transporter substrate-binding protein [Comamonas sp. NLF-1-9]